MGPSAKLGRQVAGGDEISHGLRYDGGDAMRRLGVSYEGLVTLVD